MSGGSCAKCANFLICHTVGHVRFWRTGATRFGINLPARGANLRNFLGPSKSIPYILPTHAARTRRAGRCAAFCILSGCVAGRSSLLAPLCRLPPASSDLAQRLTHATPPPGPTATRSCSAQCSHLSAPRTRPPPAGCGSPPASAPPRHDPAAAPRPRPLTLFRFRPPARPPPRGAAAGTAAYAVTRTRPCPVHARRCCFNVMHNGRCCVAPASSSPNPGVVRTRDGFNAFGVPKKAALA